MNLESIILGLVGAGVQVFIKFFPKFSDWYAVQKYKAWIAIGIVFAVSMAYFGLSCTALADTLGIAVACDQSGAIELLGAFLSILVGQQFTFVLFGKKE